MAKKGVYRPSRDELGALLDSGKTTTEISEQYGVTRQAVRMWGKRYGIYPAVRYAKDRDAFLGVRMSSEQNRKLRRAANRARKSMSEIVRQWIDTLE